jgi:hypothetical protein
MQSRVISKAEFWLSGAVGGVALMRGIEGDVEISYPGVMFKNNLQLRWNFRFPREANGELIRMVEIGLLRIGAEVGQKPAGRFALEDWNLAFTAAAEKVRIGEEVSFIP